MGFFKNALGFAVGFVQNPLGATTGLLQNWGILPQSQQQQVLAQQQAMSNMIAQQQAAFSDELTAKYDEILKQESASQTEYTKYMYLAAIGLVAYFIFIKKP